MPESSMVVGAIAVILIQISAPAAGPTDIVPARQDTATVRASADSAAAALRRESFGDARAVPAWAYPAAADTQPRRRRAIEYSDWYYRRLQVHRWGSWIELPVFGTEYWLGQKLINDVQLAGWVKPAHSAVAGVLGGLFAINTITGIWNLYDSRNDTEDRKLVWTHSALMLASDAGFAITGAIGHHARFAGSRRTAHKNIAIASMSLATAGTVLMWIKRGF